MNSLPPLLVSCPVPSPHLFSPLVLTASTLSFSSSTSPLLLLSDYLLNFLTHTLLLRLILLFWPLSQQFLCFHLSGGKKKSNLKNPINNTITLCIISEGWNNTGQVGDGVRCCSSLTSIRIGASDLWAWGRGCCEAGLLLWTQSISGCPFISSAQRHEMESPPPLYREAGR